MNYRPGQPHHHHSNLPLSEIRLGAAVLEEKAQAEHHAEAVRSLGNLALQTEVTADSTANEAS